jgi:hypothetical protein
LPLQFLPFDLSFVSCLVSMYSWKAEMVWPNSVLLNFVWERKLKVISRLRNHNPAKNVRFGDDYSHLLMSYHTISYHAMPCHAMPSHRLS